MTKECPFDKSPMEPWRTPKHENHVDTLLKCPKCGFIATFRKAVKKPEKKVK